MNDMSSVIVPRSDQVNADDYVSGPRTYTIEGVAISPGTEQPVSIRLSGEERVWRPCKSMSRVLVAMWGPDAKAYTGRSLTLYRDPDVTWAGLKVGGIRISHMSHIERDHTMALTVTRQSRKPFTVKPLRRNPAQEPPPPPERPAESASAPTEPEATTAAGQAQTDFLTDVERAALAEDMAKLSDKAFCQHVDQKVMGVCNAAEELSTAWDRFEPIIKTRSDTVQERLKNSFSFHLGEIMKGEAAQ